LVAVAGAVLLQPEKMAHPAVADQAVPQAAYRQYSVREMPVDRVQRIQALAAAGLAE
jgi:hypothetical protein